MNKWFENYKSQISKRLDIPVENIFLYWKGRVALFALLDALGVSAEDEVIIPAYTCVVVPNAVKYLGATPVYVDIDCHTYNLDASLRESKITRKTKVIICQNTYGLSSAIDEINLIAGKYGIRTLEDCTHGYGGYYNGRPNGTTCDAAFFSTQWNKPFSTGLGGFSVTSDALVAEKLRKLDAKLLPPKKIEVASLKLLYRIREYAITDSTYWTMVKLYRYLSRHNIVLGSSSAEELGEITKPVDYFKSMSAAQAKLGAMNHRKIDYLIKKRMESAKVYSEILSRHGKTYVLPDQFKNHSFVTYPALVHDRQAFMPVAESAKIQLNDWFTSPLHPIQGDLTPWDFDRSAYPVAEKICRHVINLPTTPTDNNKVGRFVENNIDQFV